MQITERTLTNLKRIVSTPTTSYFEHGVVKVLSELLDIPEITLTTDRYGNLIAQYIGDTKARPIAYVAHMDHPGIEVVSPTQARLHGGVRARYLKGPVPVKLYCGCGLWTNGQVSSIVQNPDDQDDTLLDLTIKGDVHMDDAFGVWDLPDFMMVGNYQEDGVRLHMRAADDLAGCSIIVETLLRLTESQAPVNVLGVFTRAEETGLNGATLMGRDGKTIPKDAIVVSVETSKELPGAEIGKGAVIRVGDASAVFSSRVDYLLKTAARELAAEDGDFLFQRQLMSGGVCEAASFMLFGYETIGIALPLGNYHNMRNDDADATKLLAEYISPSDIESAIRMSVRLAQNAKVLDLATSPAAEMLTERAESNKERLIKTASQIIEVI